MLLVWLYTLPLVSLKRPKGECSYFYFANRMSEVEKEVSVEKEEPKEPAEVKKEEEVKTKESLANG